ncbi:uncharacterized protein J3D65DRAFT_620041 [Phyllosticta citribraziliensis]|uniref:Uncharacterized protein n=1 Tax=Phyllosticta citribraziliensis TaxID=989973 RepID=A0ABR1LZ30_9PEZI
MAIPFHPPLSLSLSLLPSLLALQAFHSIPFHSKPCATQLASACVHAWPCPLPLPTSPMHLPTTKNKGKKETDERTTERNGRWKREGRKGPAACRRSCVRYGTWRYATCVRACVRACVGALYASSTTVGEGLRTLPACPRASS